MINWFKNQSNWCYQFAVTQSESKQLARLSILHSMALFILSNRHRTWIGWY